MASPGTTVHGFQAFRPLAALSGEALRDNPRNRSGRGVRPAYEMDHSLQEIKLAHMHEVTIYLSRLRDQARELVLRSTV